MFVFVDTVHNDSRASVRRLYTYSRYILKVLKVISMVIGCVRARRAQENLQNFRQFTKLSFCPLPPSKQTLVPAVEFIDEVVSSPCSSSSSSLAFCMQLPPMQKNLVEISHASSAIIDEQPAPSQVVAAHLSLWSHKSLKGSAIASPFSRIHTIDPPSL